MTTLFNKKLNTLTDYNNIVGKIDKFNIITTNMNFCTMFELEGANYFALNKDKIEKLSNVVNSFLSSIDSSFSVSIFYKKESNSQKIEDTINNEFAEQIINKHNEHMSNTYTIKYLISISTNLKNNKNIETDMIDKLAVKILVKLKEFNIKRLSSEEVLSFYASYCNLRETKVHNLKDGLLSDSYINSNLIIKNNYMISENYNSNRYMRIISIKEYDADYVDSDYISTLLKSDFKFLICQSINYVNPDKTIRFLDKKISSSSIYIEKELSQFREEIKTGRQVMYEYSFSVMLIANTLKELDYITTQTTSIFETNHLSYFIESHNLSMLYLSYFPNQQQLNVRKRKQAGDAIVKYNFYEENMKGLSCNDFGNKEVTTFLTENLTPYKMNFHVHEGKKAKSHTIILGISEDGKTTLFCFLMTSLLKYEKINILAFDKKYGMYSFCKYMGGNYSEVNEKFSLNPFSLKDSKENRVFLLNFLKIMANIKDEEAEEIQAITKCIETMMRLAGKTTKKNNLSLFLDTLEGIEGLEIRFSAFKDSILDNEVCTLDFSNKLNVLAMDGILNDKKMSSLVSLYVSHKLNQKAQENREKFFVFYDELKDYLDNDITRKIILEQIVESRKAGGTVCVAVQNLDFFDDLENKDTILDGFGQYIVFPTSSKEAINRLNSQSELSQREINFLNSSNSSKKEKHRILLKIKGKEETKSLIVDISLNHLGKYLKVFNSNEDTVSKIRNLQKSGDNWREEFLGRDDE